MATSSMPCCEPIVMRILLCDAKNMLRSLMPILCSTAAAATPAEAALASAAQQLYQSLLSTKQPYCCIPVFMLLLQP